MAATAAWNTIREAIRAIGTVLSESGTVTQDIGRSIIDNMHSMSEISQHMNVRIEQGESNMNTLSTMVTNEIRTLNDKISHMQGVIDSNKDRNTHRKQGILESKSVQSIKSLGSDKGVLGCGTRNSSTS